jgi:hypothetical protein
MGYRSFVAALILFVSDSIVATYYADDGTDMTMVIEISNRMQDFNKRFLLYN